jgi:hypothetical protein
MPRQMRFEPIDCERFRSRIQDNFSSGYLTLISIIQGVAFGIWVANVSSSLDIQNIQLYRLIYPFLSFLGVIFVFYYYSWFVSVVYTPPNLRESSIPLILAAAEVAPMYFFNQPSYWWLLSGVFCFVCAIAFGNTLIVIRENIYEDDFRPAVRVMRIELWSNIILCMLLGSLAYFAWENYPQDYKFFSEGMAEHEIGFLIAFCLIVLLMVSKSQFWFLRRVYVIGGLKDKRT